MKSEPLPTMSGKCILNQEIHTMMKYLIHGSTFKTRQMKKHTYDKLKGDEDEGQFQSHVLQLPRTCQHLVD